MEAIWDTTIIGINLTSEKLSEISKEIVKISTDESFSFAFDTIKEIREIDDYPGFR